MAESDTVSNSSSSLAELPDVPVVGEEDDLGRDGGGGSLLDREANGDLQGATERLEQLTLLQPDVDILSTAFAAQDTDSTGAASSSSSARDPQDHSRSDNSDDDDDDDSSSVVTRISELNDVTSHNGSTSSRDKDKEGKGEKKKSLTGAKDSKAKKEGSSGGKKRKNPLSVLKKLTKYDKSKYKSEKKKTSSSSSEFEQVRIDRLPQVFVAKYLGMREVRGFSGLHHVRTPVDEMVTLVQKNLEKQEQVELPLVYVVVSPKGLDVREHKLNKQKEGVPLGLVPIDFISYGVQDIKYWRVFTYIVVRELSSRSKLTECHAYLCDSSLNARKMALSLGASFRIYSRNLKKEGKFHNFQVELRPPDQLAEALEEEDA